MSEVILFLSLLLVYSTAQTVVKVHKNCKDDAALDCPVISSGHMEFASFTWYKYDTPIIRRGKTGKQHSNISRYADLGENLSLILLKLKPEDSGHYKCYLRANVGKQSKEGYVHLSVNECVNQTESTTEATILSSTEFKLLSPVKDFPFTWSIAGYLLVALAKIVLSLISIQMIRVMSWRQQKNRFTL